MESLPVSPNSDHPIDFHPSLGCMLLVFSTKNQGLLLLKVRTFTSILITVSKCWSWTPKNIAITQGAYQNTDSSSPDSCYV